MTAAGRWHHQSFRVIKHIDGPPNALVLLYPLTSNSPRMCTEVRLITFDKALEVFQELDVLLMLDGRAQLRELIGEGVVDPTVSQEVHQMVIQGLRNSTRK